MTFSEIFIRRRVGTSLLALGVTLIGALAFFLLPVAPLPQVDFPTIQVVAHLPGASAETMATSVTTPLEREFSVIPGTSEMTSSSALGSSAITLQFDLSKNIDGAAQDVQTAINAAQGTLPKNLPSPPTYYKVNPADAPLLSLALTSDTLSLPELGRYAEDFITQQLTQMPGVGFIDYHGQQRPAVRVQLDPDRVAGMGLTLEDVRDAIGSHSVNSPKGTLNGPHQAVVLQATDQILNAEGYRSLVVASRNGAPIRLGELGSVIDAAEDMQTAAWVQGKRAILIDVHKQVGFNVVSTVQQIKERLTELAALLPPAAKLRIVSDRTQTIRGSVHDVEFTILLTIGLVVGVIFLFLRNLRATAIPSLTIPLSLIATFAVMYVLHYSVDNLSLMALTIAVGFVMDDAIVVIENVVRHLERGEPRMQATVAGVREVASTIVSMTLSLMAVFIPVLFMGGVTGRYFREFGVTISVAVLMSGIFSLTVTPMACAWLLRHQPSRARGRLYQWSERFFDRVNDTYARWLSTVLQYQRLTLVVMLATVCLAGALYVLVPKGFFPAVDTGLIDGFTQASPDISFDAMSGRMRRIGDIVMADPDVADVGYWIGANPTISQGRVMVSLKPFGHRGSTAAQIADRLKRRVAGVEGISLNLQPRQDLRIGGRITASQYQYTLKDADVPELDKWATVMLQKLKSLPQLRDVTSDAQASATTATLKIDRDTASRLGITTQAIDDTLYDAFGQRQVATLFTQLNQYHVVEEVDPRFQLSTEALKHLYLRSSISNQLVPLSLLATVVDGVSSPIITHQALFPSVTLSFNLAPGYALGDAVDAVRIAEGRAGKPSSVVAGFQGTAQAFQSSLKSQPWLIVAALVAVYIVLGVLYESAIHPLTVISTLPSAGVGALVALILFGYDLSVMGLIGIFLLIGIVKKNAIMMIDFALVAQREQGLSPREAIYQGALLRFRPIMMTTMAALLGALPLALGTGPGSELRVPLGISIAGGLLVSQALTLFTTPVVYIWFERMRQASRGAERSQSEGVDLSARHTS